MKLEEMMLEDGWKKVTSMNAGKIYVEWHKQGFLIDEGDIIIDSLDTNKKKEDKSELDPRTRDWYG